MNKYKVTGYNHIPCITDESGMIVASFGRTEDAKNIAAIIDSQAALLEELKQAEWAVSDVLTPHRCPSCMEPKKNGHRHDCKLRAAIAATEPDGTPEPQADELTPQQALHRAWTFCVGTECYEKGEWKAVERQVDKAAATEGGE